MGQGYIGRPHYEELLEAHRDTDDIKVMTGVRRCGKSTLMEAFAHRMEEQVGPANVFYRRMDALGIPLSPDAAWLEREVSDALAHSDSSKKLYVFLDEVQEVAEWEKVVRRLHTQPQADVYITGSNAHVLSSDLATLLGGRYVTIRVYPLSFAEFCEFSHTCGVEFASREALFASYVRYGGMPAQFGLPERDERRLLELLSAIYDTVILNDVAMHTRIGDLDLLSKLVRYVFSTSGSLFSTRNIVNALVSVGRKTSVDTVDNYLRALMDAYILGECEQVGLAGKQILRPQRKFYPVDNGLRNLMTSFSPSGFGAQLECVVFNELVRRGYQVEVGTLHRGEIDFVAQRSAERQYIQVCEALSGQETYERELAPFRGLPDSFPCLLLTLDDFHTGTTETGVRIVNLIDWLLE
ncbi:ATP-binding protein [Olsenella sp. Marseille-P4559]|uniref:ATP-binding protein n=1 Tax=Olsenella sp. Marseille-P4559 TaxID=2364795 RepID=UPI001031649A|nr:ATP-binding protein [Olsenella sp. Marseille-P4559]